jgi:hypothetical protein
VCVYCESTAEDFHVNFILLCLYIPLILCIDFGGEHGHEKERRKNGLFILISLTRLRRK